MDWNIITTITDNLSIYLLGSSILTALVLCVMFIILLTTRGVNITTSILLTMPILGGFSMAGFLGSSNWIFNIILMIVGVLYAYSLIKLTT
jgi:hypothetical protein